MAESLYDAAERTLRKEYLRFTGVKVTVATDEQIAKMRDTNPDAKPNAQMVVEWEPLSYRKEGGKYGNTETDYLKMTTGDGLAEEEVDAVRRLAWRGIPTNKRMTIPKSNGEAKRPWERWMIKARAAGLRMEIGDDGQLTSPDIGKVYEVEAGFDSFPQWDSKKGKNGAWTDPEKGEKASSPYVRYPVKLAADYVAPDDVPVRFVGGGDDDGANDGAAVTATAGVSGGVTGAQLAAALAEAGVIGSKASDFESAAAQINVTNTYGSSAPVLFLPEIQNACATGDLLNLAVAKGAIAILDGVIEQVA